MIHDDYVTTTALNTHRSFCTNAGQMNARIVSDPLSDTGCLSCLSLRMAASVKSSSRKYGVVWLAIFQASRTQALM